MLKNLILKTNKHQQQLLIIIKNLRQSNHKHHHHTFRQANEYFQLNCNYNNNRSSLFRSSKTKSLLVVGGNLLQHKQVG